MATRGGFFFFLGGGVSSLVLFKKSIFWPTDPKIFLKAPLTPIYTNFVGEQAPKSAQKRLF